MKRILFLMTILLAGMATAYPQMKMQFVEVQLGQSNMLQGHGYSLFDKAVGDNVAFGESIHLGWGKDASRSLGAYLGSNIVSMPYYEEVTAAFSLGFEMRRYLEVNPSLRCYSGMTLGGICVANGYKLTGKEERETRWGVAVEYIAGAEVSFGEHLYVGASLHFSANLLFGSTFESSAATPDEGSNSIIGNKIMLTAGYRL